MSTLIHSFDEDGYYAGSAEMPPGAIGANPEVATIEVLPFHNPQTQRLRRINRVVTVEAIPKPEPEPEPEPETLEQAKARKNSEINAARLHANRTSFTHEGKYFACDELSRSDIDGTNGYVTLNGALPVGWPGGWKAIDNTYLPIADLQAWKAFYSAMFAAGNANFGLAQALKSQLESATTIEQVNAINWSSA